jgi:hypothetical protein
VQHGGEPGFTDELCYYLRLVGKLRQQSLDHHHFGKTFRSEHPCPIDLGHAAAAEEFEQLVSVAQFVRECLVHKVKEDDSEEVGIKRQLSIQPALPGSSGPPKRLSGKACGDNLCGNSHHNTIPLIFEK